MAYSQWSREGLISCWSGSPALAPRPSTLYTHIEFYARGKEDPRTSAVRTSQCRALPYGSSCSMICSRLTTAGDLWDAASNGHNRASTCRILSREPPHGEMGAGFAAPKITLEPGRRAQAAYAATGKQRRRTRSRDP